MKKLLIPLIAAFAANTVSAAAPQQVIDISTDKVSMVLTAAPGGEVYFRHFGGRIDDPAPLADYKSNRRSDHGPRTWPIPRREAATSANPPCASPMPTAT